MSETVAALGFTLVEDVLKAVVLGLIQGLTEFLPISSSAHLRIYPELFGWGDPGAAFTAVIQIGTELAVLIYFRQDIWRILTTWLRSLVRAEYRGHRDARMGWFIIIGSLPIVVLGVLLKDVIEKDFRSLWLIAGTLVVFGVVLGIADRVGGTEKQTTDITLRDAVLMGLAQACALVPGVSRSGATLSMGRFLGYDREAATRYAFLLAVPAVVGAGLFELKDIPNGDNAYGWGPTVVATVVSFVVGYAAIAWLLRYVSTKSYTPFVLYRVALGVAAFVLLGSGVLSAAADRQLHQSQPDFLNTTQSADRRHHHQQHRERVAEEPAELRHVLEVHAVDAGDQRRAWRRGRCPPRSCACRCSAGPRSAPGARRTRSTAGCRGSSTTSAAWLRWSSTSRKNGAASVSTRETWPSANLRIGSRSGSTARRTSAISRFSV